MDYLTEFPLAPMDRRPRKKPRFAWDGPQSHQKVYLFYPFLNFTTFFGDFISDLEQRASISISILLQDQKIFVDKLEILNFGFKSR